MNEKGNYILTQTEIDKAENIMTDEQRKDSETRAENWEQEQPPWEPFDEYINENFERKPITAERENELNNRIKELGAVFNDSNLNWHLDGALNISLMNDSEYIGYHKDVDISVEKEELAKLEAHLLKNGYGLFLSRTERKDKNKVMRRVGYENFQDSEAEHMMIAAINENGKIRRDKFLNFVDVHIAERNENGQLLSKSGVVLPEKWGQPYPVEFQGQQINLSHPAKVLYFKIHQGRNYDATDIQRLIETGKVMVEDIDEVSEIFEKEFAENRNMGRKVIDDIAVALTPEMTADEIFGVISSHPILKSRVEKDRHRFLEFSQKISELKDMAGESLFQLAADFFDIDGKENKMREKMRTAKSQMEDAKKLAEVREKLDNMSEVEDFILTMESLGARIDDKSKARLVDILSSPQIVHVDRNELVRLFGVDKNDSDLIRKLYKPFNEKYGKILRRQLAKENKEFFSGAELKLINHQEVQIDGETIDMADLNDSEISEFGVEKIKRIIYDIINDKNGTAGQGMFWNVLVPKEISYVLKTERQLHDKGKEKYSRESLLRYPIIRGSIGKEFLPKQAVLRTEGSEQLHILQEKMPLQKMTSIRNGNIDTLVSGDYGQEITQALADERNKEKLEVFIDGVERLYKEHKLMIDTIGDNLFFSVSENGGLDIKLVDYGALKQEWDEPSKEIKESLVFLEKLKHLTQIK